MTGRYSYFLVRISLTSFLSMKDPAVWVAKPPQNSPALNDRLSLAQRPTSFPQWSAKLLYFGGSAFSYISSDFFLVDSFTSFICEEVTPAASNMPSDPAQSRSIPMCRMDSGGSSAGTGCILHFRDGIYRIALGSSCVSVDYANSFSGLDECPVVF